MSVEDISPDALVAAFKRKGHFDALRKEILGKFKESETGSQFDKGLEEVVNEQISKDPELLKRDRGKAASLAGGAIDRTNLYSKTRMGVVDEQLNQGEFHSKVAEALRSIHEEEIKRRKTESNSQPMAS